MKAIKGNEAAEFDGEGLGNLEVVHHYFGIPPEGTGVKAIMSIPPGAPDRKAAFAAAATY